MKSEGISAVIPPLIDQYIDVFICPVCGGALNVSGGYRIVCSKCNRYFKCESGIPLLFWPNEWGDSKPDVTETVKSFYEKTPFPNYEDSDSRRSFRKKAEKGIFARLLDNQIPSDAMILEIGCGTGQLSNFLGMKGERKIFATDICLNSLRLGQEFKEKNQIDNVIFLQMNLFRPVFRPESFDLIICNGVLHHTSDPFLGFQLISKLVRKGGFVIVGLYNAYGRIPADIKRLIFRLSGNRFKFLDPRLKDKGLSAAKKHAWFVDQYKNPHESKHTIGEVLTWFQRSGIDFMSGIPKPTVFESFSSEENLFEASPRGTALEHFFAQLNMLLEGGREGGFFIMVGRKRHQEHRL